MSEQKYTIVDWDSGAIVDSGFSTAEAAHYILTHDNNTYDICPTLAVKTWLREYKGFELCVGKQNRRPEAKTLLLMNSPPHAERERRFQKGLEFFGDFFSRETDLCAAQDEIFAAVVERYDQFPGRYIIYTDEEFAKMQTGWDAEELASSRASELPGSTAMAAVPPKP